MIATKYQDMPLLIFGVLTYETVYYGIFLSFRKRPTLYRANLIYYNQPITPALNKL